MNDPSSAAKPKPDQKRYVVVQFVMNLVGVVVVVAFLAWLVFGLFGPGTGTMIEVRGFMLLFLFCFVVIQCHTAVVNTRRDYIRGRWVMADPAGLAPDGVINPWRRFGPLAVPAGALIGLAVWFLLPLGGGESFRLLTIDAIAFVPLLVGSTALIAFILPRDQVSFVAALEGEGAGVVPSFGTYFVREHLLPWAMVQGLINLGIGLKQFLWALQYPEPAEKIPYALVGWDFGIVFGILYFFMFISSDAQVRADARLGRLTPKAFSISALGRVGVPVVAIGVILSTVLTMAAVGSIMQILLPAAGFEELSVETAVALKTSAAIFGTLMGCGVGVWWGRRAESALMAGEASG